MHTMSEEANAASGDFPVETTVVVQWGDQDAFGHVNNTVFLRWFETGRIAYFSRILMPHEAAGAGRGVILAATTCNFRREVTFPDEVVIASRVTRIGRSSLTLDHRVVSRRHGAVAADGTSTVVHFDYQSRRSLPIPDELRRAIEAVEASVGPRASLRPEEG